MAGQSGKSKGTPARRKSVYGGMLLVAVLAGALGVAAWSALESRAEREDPNVVVNLTSMLGKPAPAFTLVTAEGRPHEVTPGNGRKYVLIFHMGSA